MRGFDNYDLAFSRDGGVLAACFGWWSIKVWDVKTGDERAILEGPHANLSVVAFSPGGTLIASTSQGDVYVWRIPRKR